jgi:hypothetical protein
MKTALLALAFGLLLGGCGKHYWESRGSDRGLFAFRDDSALCIEEAKTAKYGFGAEEIYRACMKAHGWRRSKYLVRRTLNIEARRMSMSSPPRRGHSASAAQRAERETRPV